MQRDNISQYCKGDRIAAIIFAAFLVVYGLEGREMPVPLEADVVGPGLFPRIISIFGLLLCLILYIKPHRRGSDESIDIKWFLKFATNLTPLVLLLVYALVLEYIGFPLATFSFLVFSFRFLGNPSWSKSCIMGLIITVVAFGIFYYLLDVRLPIGSLYASMFSNNSVLIC